VIQGKSVLAIIPARGGSKRLPRKNVLSLAGKPLIVWTIEAAQKTKYIDRIIVSTDDQEIVAVSKKAGAEIIIRHDDLASDTATSFDVVKHVIDTIDEKYDFTLLLQPTSPLRTEHHIDEACELLIQKNADAIISVTEMDHSPLWANTLPEDGDMGHFLKAEIIGKRSQDLQKYYRLNGAIYICRTEKLLTEKSFFISDKIFAYKTIKETSVDIDEYSDLLFAQWLLSQKL